MLKFFELNADNDVAARMIHHSVCNWYHRTQELILAYLHRLPYEAKSYTSISSIVPSTITMAVPSGRNFELEEKGGVQKSLKPEFLC